MYDWYSCASYKNDKYRCHFYNNSYTILEREVPGLAFSTIVLGSPAGLYVMGGVHAIKGTILEKVARLIMVLLRIMRAMKCIFRGLSTHVICQDVVSCTVHVCVYITAALMKPGGIIELMFVCARGAWRSTTHC